MPTSPTAPNTAPSSASHPVARPVAPSLTAALCPYCGVVLEDGSGAPRCGACKGLIDPLSRQATQNAMGPWKVRDEHAPHGPGCSYDTLKALVARGRIRRDTVVRGPTTRQFWMFAANAPGVAVLLGECHACHHAVRPEEFLCSNCGAGLCPPTDRQTLGLAPVRLLPGAASAPAIAASAVRPLATSISIPEPRPIETPPPLRRGPAPEAPALVEQAIEPASPSPSVSMRRIQDRVHTLTVALVIAVVVLAALFVVLVVMAVQRVERPAPASTPAPAHTSSPAPAPAPNPAPTTATSEAGASEAPASAPSDSHTDVPAFEIVGGAPIDAGLGQWHPDIAKAMDLERTDTLAALDEAIGILDHVEYEATRRISEQDLDASSFPILRARLAAWRERSEAWHARTP